MRLIRLNLKVIFSSVILYLFYAFIALFFLFFLVMMNQTRFINYAVFLDSLAYLEIAVFILAFCLAVYFAHQGYALEESCFVSKPACLLGRLSAVLIASGCVCAVPLLYIVAASVSEGTELYFSCLAIAYFILRWLSLLLISQSLGFLAGSLLKKTFVYLLAAPFAIIFSHLNGSFLSMFLNADRIIVVSNLLSLQKPLIFGVDIDYAGPRVDLLFAVKCALVLPFALFIASAAVAAAQKKFAPKTAAAMCSCLAAIALFCHIYISIFPKGYSYEDKLYVTADRSGGYRVASYEGNIRLSECGDYECLVTVEKGRGDLTFRLDGAFEIRKLSLEGRDVRYSRSGDFIVIPENEIPDRDSFSVELLYGGRVRYRSDADSLNIYTSWFSSALPPNFAFIPIIDGDLSVKAYNFHVTCANTLISNLAVESGGGYTVSGKSNTFCLFCGFLTQFEKEGVIFYRAKYNKSTDYWGEYQSALTRRYLNPHTYEIASGAIVKPQKVFMIYYLYGIVGNPVVFNDYIMLNYGYPG